MDATVVCIDQIEKPVQAEPRIAWFPCGLQPTVQFPDQRNWACLLGVSTEDAECFFSRFPEYATCEHVKTSF